MGLGGGPIMMMKDSWFLLISTVLGRECGAGRGPYNDDEGFFVSADFKCFFIRNQILLVVGTVDYFKI